METKNLSRAYLETLSSADLFALADDYGIDVPENLTRRFLIGELLDVAEELVQEHLGDDMAITEDAAITEELPESFNETQIDVVLRNPVWAYVYWDISASELARCTAGNGFKELLLRVSFFADEDAQLPEESFDLPIALSVREQYVLLPAGKQFVRVDLVLKKQGKGDDTIAYTRKVALPQDSPLLSAALPGYEVQVSKIAELSSLKELLHEHYENHRQSFLS